MNKILLAFKRQFLIFLAYLFLSSLILFNHTGGTDIAFFIFMTIGAFLHFVVVTIKVIMTKKTENFNGKKINWLDIIAVLSILTLFVITSNYYIDFMWWVSTGFKEWQHNIEPSVDVESIN